jgi:hypothetical protein
MSQSGKSIPSLIGVGAVGPGGGVVFLGSSIAADVGNTGAGCTATGAFTGLDAIGRATGTEGTGVGAAGTDGVADLIQSGRLTSGIAAGISSAG